MESYPRPSAQVASTTRPPSSSTQLASTTQSAPATQSALALYIRRLVMRRTGGQVRDLQVEVHSNHVCLKGRCPSFYCKQLAQQAAMSLSGVESLTNEIEVVWQTR